MPDSIPFENFAEDLIARDGEFPITASIEITSRCNLKCAYCYMCAYRDEEEMSTGEIMRIMEELAEAGCINLLITGGEPLLRPDFAEIWRKAKSLGFMLTLFTNATLVTKETAALLKELPPLLTEVTLYGASEETYENFTGKRAFADAVRGINLLKNSVRAMHVKSPVTTVNEHEFADMEKLVAEWDLPFYVDTDIFPRLDGDASPLQYMISDTGAGEKAFDNPQHREIWLKEFGSAKRPTRLDKVVVCRGGERNIHIGPYADACICMLLREPRVSLREMPLAEAWRIINGKLRSRSCTKPRKCYTCDVAQYCVPCAGKNFLATGDEETPSPQVCQRTRNIAQVMKRLQADER